jgi:hypothetical protein
MFMGFLDAWGRLRIPQKSLNPKQKQLQIKLPPIDVIRIDKVNGKGKLRTRERRKNL